MDARVVAGRYQLLRLLGRGGMGAVWLAEDSLARRMVAVKELRAPQGLGAADREKMEKRAMLEAQSAARIHHPHAVTLFDVIPASDADAAIYLILEYVDGVTLAQAIQQDGRIGEARATALCLHLLSVLEVAHEMAIIHRDIKPANIMITKDGQAKLTDFGIAYTVGATRLTGSGVIGTLPYMAPELFESGTITPAADLWSLGATLYHAVEGRSPFDREATGATMRAILFDELPPAASASPLSRVITGMLNRDPASRISIQQARTLLEGAMDAREYRPARTEGPDEYSPTETVRREGRSPGSQGTTAPGRKPGGPYPAAAPQVPRTVFTSAPGGGRHGCLLAFLILVLVTGLIVLGAEIHSWPAAIAGIALFCAAPLGYRVFMDRHPVLKVSGTALTRSGGKGATRHIPWQQITRIGPDSREGQEYLYAWLNEGSKPIQLCPLEPQFFPPTEIRAAILAHRPTVNIDPL